MASRYNAYASNYKFTPYVQGPKTSHIAWLRQGALAGIAAIIVAIAIVEAIIIRKKTNPFSFFSPHEPVR